MSANLITTEDYFVSRTVRNKPNVFSTSLHERVVSLIVRTNTRLRVSMDIERVLSYLVKCLGVNEGLGYFILDTRDRLAYSELMVEIVIIGLIGGGLDSLLRFSVKYK